MAQTFSPTATYGSNSVKNRIRPGGSLGSNQYYYTTNASTGEITVNRLVRQRVGRGSFRDIETEVGTIPQGGKFTPNSSASSAEKSHYSSSREVGKARQQALQVARREWDGQTQPPPTQAIYGTNSGNIGYTPAGSGTALTSTRGTQEAGYSTDTNSNTDSSRRSNTGDTLRALGEAGVRSGLSGILGGGSGGKVLVYPATLRQTGNAQDYIKIDRLKYEPKTRDGYTWSQRSGGDSRTNGSVVLPIPGGISDANAVSWGGDKMDPAQTAMANLALSGIEKGFEGMANEAEAIGKKIQNNSKEVKDAVSKGIAGMASGTGAQLLTRTTGQILNPNMELLFKDPSLRPFTFTWKLAARNREEANTIIQIINFFKRGMAPQTTGENLFLSSPNTWRLRYMHKGNPHPYLNKFKECAMTSLTTQYTPDGNYATFETGHMTAYSITMALQELEPVFSSDYNSDNEIGY